MILASSVCFLGGILARNRDLSSSSFNLAQLAYFFAAVLGLAGLIFLSRGLADEHEGQTAQRQHNQLLDEHLE